MDAFLTPGIPQVFRRRGFHTNALHGQSAEPCDRFAHLLLVRQDLRGLQDKRCIYIDGGIAPVGKHRDRMFNETIAGSPFPLRIGIGEVFTDVSQRQSAKKGIYQCMQYNVPIAVSHRTDL